MDNQTETAVVETEKTATTQTETNAGGESKGGEQTVTQPSLEQRIADLEKKNEDILKGFYATSQEKAEISRQLENVRFERDQLAIAAASNANRRTVLDDLQDEIKQAVKDGDELRATRLTAELATVKAEARTIQNSVNAVKTIISAHGPTMSKEEKAELYSDLYINGDPKMGFRDVATVERFLADPDKIIRDAKLKARGVEVESGEYDKRFVQKQKEAQMKADAEIKRQQSITQSGGGPPITGNEDEIKKKQREWMDKVMSSKFPT